jgi:2'-5' RNA ligase
MGAPQTLIPLNTQTLPGMFFIAVLPPPPIQDEVTAFKRLIADQWGPRHAFKSPPHLTLQPPFRWPQADLPRLDSCLEQVAAAHAPFPVVLEDFGAFPPRVVFVKPLASRELERLFRSLADGLAADLGFIDPRNRRPFHPHMTIAHRDLEPEQFAGIWEYFHSLSYRRQFEVKALALMRLREGKWEVGRTFALKLSV